MQAGWKRNLAIVGIIAGVYLGIRYIVPVIIPFLFGWMGAIWLYPRVCRLEKRTHIPRTVWAGIFVGLFAAVFLFSLYELCRILISQVKTFVAQYEIILDVKERWVNQCGLMAEKILGISGESIRQFLVREGKILEERVIEGEDSLVFHVADYVKNLAFSITGAIVAVISTVLFVKDLEEIRRQLRTFGFYSRWRRVLHRMKNTGLAYLKAQIIIMIFVSIICAVGFWFIKSPYYLFFGIGVGFLDALPLIGTGLVTYPAMLILFLRGNTFAAVGCAAIELATTIVREYLEPRLIGEKLGVYPVVIMASVYGGLAIFGIWGFLFGPVSLLLIYAIGKEWDLWG